MWNEVLKIGNNWNRKGNHCYHGFEPQFIDGDKVHKTQIIQQAGDKYHNQQFDGSVVQVIIDKADEVSLNLYENDYLHGVEWDTYIGASVTQTELVKKVVGRVGNGKVYGEVSVAKKVKGYLHAVVKILEIEDLGDSVRFVYGPVA